MNFCHVFFALSLYLSLSLSRAFSPLGARYTEFLKSAAFSAAALRTANVIRKINGYASLSNK